MTHSSKVIQRHFGDSKFRNPYKSGQFESESVATFVRNRWPVWTRMGGHFEQEYALDESSPYTNMRISFNFWGNSRFLLDAIDRK